MLNIKRIHVWESEGFWVIDFYETLEVNGDETIKLCSKTKPDIVFQPRYKKPIIIQTNNQKESSKQ